MRHTITLIPGDGIGPEVVSATVRVVRAVCPDVSWETVEAGAAVAERRGTAMPDEVLESVRKNRVALKGPIGTPIGKGFRSVNVGLRQALDLYACLRPVKSIPGVPSRYAGVDVIVVRENTEGLYAGLEHMVVPGVAESLKIISEKACLRISDYAFRMARHRGRRRVTVVHKANIMKLSDGLFLSCAERVSRRYSSWGRSSSSRCSLPVLRRARVAPLPRHRARHHDRGQLRDAARPAARSVRRSPDGQPLR
jgi:isocitrate dehydrogenase (NAD+)